MSRYFKARIHVTGSLFEDNSPEKGIDPDTYWDSHFDEIVANSIDSLFAKVEDYCNSPLYYCEFSEEPNRFEASSEDVTEKGIHELYTYSVYIFEVVEKETVSNFGADSI